MSTHQSLHAKWEEIVDRLAREASDGQPDPPDGDDRARLEHEALAAIETSEVSASDTDGPQSSELRDLIGQYRTLEEQASEVESPEAIAEDYEGPSFAHHRRAVRLLALRQQRKLGAGNLEPVRNFTVSVDPALPPLAWLCRIQDGTYEVTTGDGVERRGDGVFEGVWAGDFATSRVEESDLAFGSGVVRRERVVFVAPKHTLEFLYVLVDAECRTTLVSNSLCFALAEAGIGTADPFFGRVAETLNASTDVATAAGIDRYDPPVCADPRYRLLRMMFYNFSADGAGNIRLEGLRSIRPAETYAAYRELLGATVAAVFANARDDNRAKPLRPVTAISKGYDSPAVSLLAAEHGCAEALTLDVTVYGLSDSGAEIAEQLGLSVSAHRHVMADDIPTLNLDFHGELKAKTLEFLATPGVGDDVTFLPFEAKLARSLLLTGALGDSIWDRRSTLPPGLPVRVKFGKSLTEFRLRAGFAHVPLPFVGAGFPHAMKSISASAEMAPYTLGTKYDRPIPRRMLEEAGVPREAFGIKKNMTAPHVLNHMALFEEAMRTVMARYRRGAPAATARTAS